MRGRTRTGGENCVISAGALVLVVGAWACSGGPSGQENVRQSNQSLDMISMIDMDASSPSPSPSPSPTDPDAGSLDGSSGPDTGQTCASHSNTANSAEIVNASADPDNGKCRCEDGTVISDINSTELCPLGCTTHSIPGNAAERVTNPGDPNVGKCVCQDGTVITDVNSTTEPCPPRTCTQPATISATVCDGNAWDTSENPTDVSVNGGYGWLIYPAGGGDVDVRFNLALSAGDSIEIGPGPEANPNTACLQIGTLHSDCTHTYTCKWIAENTPNFYYTFGPWDDSLYTTYGATEETCNACAKLD